MVKAQPKKKPLPTLSKLKGKLDAIFSKYIRLYHAEYGGYCICYTCGSRHHWTKIQNGHLFSRARLATRFDPDNCRPQCVGCNVLAHGNYQEYFPRMIAEIGIDNMELMEQKSKQDVKLDRAFYAANIEKYTIEVNRILKEIGE